MNGRSSTFGGLLGNVLLTLGVIAALIWVCQEYVGPVVRYLLPGIDL